MFPGIRKINRRNVIGILSVTYQESFEDSPLYKSLNDLPIELKLSFKVFNFYNSSDKNVRIELSEYTEQFSTENGGLALGYNTGMDYFKAYSEVDFLLFLNSDCHLSADILEQYSNLTTQSSADFYYPSLVCRNRLISPFKKPGFNYDFYIIAWTLVRKSKLKDFNFDMRYWLDGIDYDFSVWFHEHELVGEQMQATFNHDLSVLSSYKDTPDWRILNIYKTEKLFLKEGFEFILFKGIIRAIIYLRFKLSIKLLRLFKPQN